MEVNIPTERIMKKPTQKEINDFNGTWDNETYVAEPLQADMEEQYKCQSIYQDGEILNCTCGKCEDSLKLRKKIENKYYYDPELNSVFKEGIEIGKKLAYEKCLEGRDGFVTRDGAGMYVPVDFIKALLNEEKNND